MRSWPSRGSRDEDHACRQQRASRYSDRRSEMVSVVIGGAGSSWERVATRDQWRHLCRDLHWIPTRGGTRGSYSKSHVSEGAFALRGWLFGGQGVLAVPPPRRCKDRSAAG